MKNDYDPALVEKAKKVAAGPLGKEMTKFPLRFATSILFGQKPYGTSPNSDFNNATATLVDFGQGPMAITCFHVLEAYRKKLSEGSQIIFQIGNLKIDPLNKIIDECERLDLVTIDLKDENTQKISDGGEVSSYFFSPVSWPPQGIKCGEFVAFGGFPGRWRQHLSQKKVMFDSFGSGACAVASVREDTIVCQFEREYWVYSFNLHPGEELHDIRGLSGAPVFIWRDLNFELIGIICQFSEAYDLMYVPPSKFIRVNGTIIKDF
ncbi:MAG: hypothetical protein ABSG71_03495 [Thermodesulfobacteriota bacterium]|jgi:hypothetical protein